MGNAVSNAFFDIFIWEVGPRVRDLVSHGSVDPKQIPFGIAERIVATALGLTVKYDPFLYKEGKKN